jgi:hypothetical protein
MVFEVTLMGRVLEEFTPLMAEYSAKKSPTSDALAHQHGSN